MKSEYKLRAEVIRGEISGLRIRRRKRDFILSEAQHAYMEATATGAAILGMGASAIGLLRCPLIPKKKQTGWNPSRR